VVRIEHVQAFRLARVVFGKPLEVLKQAVLTNGLCPAPPPDELELVDASIRFKVEHAAGVARAEGNGLDDFLGFEDFRQAQQNSQRMNHDVQLSDEALEVACACERLTGGTEGRQGVF
jgi:hypothetical protein